MAVELATAYISISAETSKLAPQINKAMGGVEADAGKRGKSMGGKLMGGLGVAAKAGAVAAGAAVAAGFGTALVKGFGRLQAIEQAEAKLTGLGHSAESVEKIMKNASASVKGTSFGLGDAASAAASAVASGIKPGKDLERTLTLIGDSAAIAGADFGDMAAIFNKVSAGGIIQGEELAQLGDRGIPILQLLGEELGVSALEVKKLASEGKVDFETFQNAMEAGMGGAAQESGKTFSGAMANVGAALGRIGADLLGGVFPKIAPMLQNVIGWLDKMAPVAKVVGEAIGTAMEWAGQAIGGLFDLIAKGDFTSAFREAFGVEEDHPVVLFLFGLRDTVITVFGEIKGGLTAFAAAWKFNDGEITSSGFPGVMERIGYWARQAFDYIKDTAIPAAVGFIEQFRAGEGAGGKFRDILTYVYEQAKLAFTWIRDEGLPALMALGDFILNTLWPDIKAAFIDRIWPAMVTVGGVIRDVWEKWAKPALSALWIFIRDTLAPFLVAFYQDGVKPTFDLIGKVISWTWENVVKPVWSGIATGLVGLRDGFNTAKSVITTAWDVVSTSIGKGWDAIKGVFDKFKDGLDSLKSRFSSVKNGIKDIWSNLTSAIAGPIRSVVQFINDKFLTPLENALNKIPGVSVNLPSIPVPSVPSSGGGGSGRPELAMATGGQVPGWSPNDRADNIPAWLTAKEWVVRQWASLRMQRKFPGWLEHINAHGEPPVAYASGGIVGGRGNRQPGKSGTGGFLEDGWEWLVDIVKDAGGWVKNKFADLLGGIGSSWPAQVAKGAIGGTADKLAAWLKDNIFGGDIGGGGGAGRVNYGGGYGQHPTGMPWQSIWSLIKSVVPNAIMTSNYRGGAITASGIPSLHGMGRAVDWVTPGMAGMTQAFRKVGALMPWSQHFYTPAGAGSQQGYVDDIIRRTHRDHGHTALADGGLVKPLLFDSGGYLPTGTSLVHNGTGRPEPLARTDQPMFPDHIMLVDESGALMGRMRVVADERFVAMANATARRGR